MRRKLLWLLFSVCFEVNFPPPLPGLFLISFCISTQAPCLYPAKNHQAHPRVHPAPSSFPFRSSFAAAALRESSFLVRMGFCVVSTFLKIWWKLCSPAHWSATSPFPLSAFIFPPMTHSGRCAASRSSLSLFFMSSPSQYRYVSDNVADNHLSPTYLSTLSVTF